MTRLKTCEYHNSPAKCFSRVPSFTFVKTWEAVLVYLVVCFFVFTFVMPSNLVYWVNSSIFSWGIFFDTYGEYYEDLREFHQHLPTLLKPGGIYSFFNGLCGGNAFFHVVYCHLISLELENLGFSTQLIPLPVKDCLEDEVWEGVKHKYWQLDTYYLPVC